MVLISKDSKFPSMSVEKTEENFLLNVVVDGFGLTNK